MSDYPIRRGEKIVAAGFLCLGFSFVVFIRDDLEKVVRVNFIIWFFLGSIITLWGILEISTANEESQKKGTTRYYTNVGL
jgi:hypothetical protein